MATAPLHPSDLGSKPYDKLHSLALEVQAYAHKALSLAEGIDDATENLFPEDCPKRRQDIGRVSNFAGLIHDVVTKAAEQAEEIERLAGLLSAQEGRLHV